MPALHAARLGFGLVVLLGSLILGCSQQPPATAASKPGTASEAPPGEAPGYFEEVAAASGIAFTHRNGEEADLYTILETLGGGVALLDYDRDGLLDVFLTGGGHFDSKPQILGNPCRLYRNEGSWRFRDATAEAGLDSIRFYSQGTTVGDYDNDGWPDLLVTGYGRMALLHNQQGRFSDVTQTAGLLESRPVHWSTSAAWADFDGDGRLDLFVGQYVNWSWENNPRCPGYRPGQKQDVCSPRQFQPLQPSLYLQRADGTFREASQEGGLQPGKVLGVIVADFDEDGRPDIYVANDTVDNQLYLNRGGGKFSEEAVARGVAGSESGKPDGSMGVDAADYDGSGHLSLMVANYQGEVHALYRNQGRGLFRHHSSRAGLMALGGDYVGFGAGFIDFDNDGREDLLMSNGHVVRYPPPPSTLAQAPVLLRNLWQPGVPPSAVGFAQVSRNGGPYFQAPHRGRGVAFGDLDNDGRTDLVLSHVNEPVAVLRNRVVNQNHWLGVSFAGMPDAQVIGARLELEAAGQKFVRVVKGGGSYLSANDRRVLFGLGALSHLERLTIRWPIGQVQTLQPTGVDAYMTLSPPTTNQHRP